LIIEKENIMAKNTKTVNVWDPLVRIGHWALVIAFFTAYFTEDDFITQHVWAGYVVGTVVIIRIIWGIVGSQHARFSDFIYSPSTVIGYIKNLVARKPQHFVGHNPAGGVMVIALLLSLSATVFTGLKLYAVEENAGPLANSAHALPASKLISVANASEEDSEEKYAVNEADEEFWEELHETFANLTLLLVFLHIGGVIASSVIDKEKLVKAMFTGKKEIDDTYR
jgi:cytochrome b